MFGELRIPYISLLNSFYVTYYRKDVNNSRNFILSLLAILILASLTEATHGHIFIFLLFVIQVVINEDDAEKKIQSTNDCCMNLNKLCFFLGASFIGLMLLISSKLAIIFLVVLRISTYVAFYYLKQSHKDQTEYLERLAEYQNYYLLGTIIPILITLWAKYETEPQKQYVKLFVRQ